jgi:transcriptional regulator with XRE-family HTH domain
MPKLIDKQRVYGMRSMGFTQAEIAERLGCSVRQVRRILCAANLHTPPAKAGTPLIEGTLRNIYKKFLPGEAVGVRFGVSRQAILKD